MEAAPPRGPRAGEAPLAAVPHFEDVAGLLLLGATLPLVGFASASSHVHNGRIAYAHVGNGNRLEIYTVTPSGAERRHLTSGHAYSSYEPAYSPRGRRIAFVRAFKQSDLWTMEADGAHKRDLTPTAHVNEIDPAWSPDGRQLAFAVGSHGTGQGIWILDHDGRHRLQLTSGDDSRPAWSPDGSEIAFQRYNAVSQIDSILVVPSGGGATATLSSDQGVSDLEPAWSPNGSRILFVSDRPDTLQLDLWVMNADGSNVQRVTNTASRDESEPAWSRTGGALRTAAKEPSTAPRARRSTSATRTARTAECSPTPAGTARSSIPNRAGSRCAERYGFGAAAAISAGASPCFAAKLSANIWASSRAFRS